jgi:hypothetical protein
MKATIAMGTLFWNKKDGFEKTFLCLFFRLVVTIFYKMGIILGK